MTIPNIYHFVFGLREQTEPFHLMHYLCLASCIAVNRPERIRFHYHHEPYGPLWDRIRPSLELVRIDPEQWLSEYEYSDPRIARYRYAHLADFTRLRVLLDEGGIYADMDTLFIRPIPDSWSSRQFILGVERTPDSTTGSLCNAWIAAAPGAEFCRLWLDGMRGAFDGTWSNHSTLLPYRLATESPELLQVEPPNSFYSLDWSLRDIRALWRGKVELPADAYSLHLWSHLWFEDDRVDFTTFGQRLLTAEYVRHARTTYACYARPFLPDDLGGTALDYWMQRVGDVVRHPRLTLRALLRGR